RATAGPLQDDAVVFELGGAMRGSVHVTGTHHPRPWDQFTAVRACLGPVNAFRATAPRTRPWPGWPAAAPATGAA
ncbi:hypothetical protein AB0E25_41590, partial [Streptomyces bobili]